MARVARGEDAVCVILFAAVWGDAARGDFDIGMLFRCLLYPKSISSVYCVFFVSRHQTIEKLVRNAAFSAFEDDFLPFYNPDFRFPLR
jgi:hypothetical protein